MLNPAERNRAIKKTLEAAFGRGKVTVRGSRGTAWGWVSVYIDWTPLDGDKSREMHEHCKALLRAAKIDLGKAWTDDTCQYETDKCHISFNRARYARTMKHPDGTMSVMREWHGGEWESQASADAANAAAAALDDFNYVGSRHHY